MKDFHQHANFRNLVSDYIHRRAMTSPYGAQGGLQIESLDIRTSAYNLNNIVGKSKKMITDTDNTEMKTITS